MDDSIRKPRAVLEVDILHPRDGRLHHHASGHYGTLGTKVRAREEAGEEKWEEDLLHTCEFSDDLCVIESPMNPATIPA